MIPLIAGQRFSLLSLETYSVTRIRFEACWGQQVFEEARVA